jgi:drug/metabolite transporter (DMT)-like permease
MRKQLAIAALAAAIAIWGSTFVFGVIAMRELSVLQTVTARFVIATLLLLPMTLWRREWPRHKDWPLFLVTGAIGFPVGMLLLFSGLEHAGVVVTSLLYGAYPIFIALAALLFDSEKPRIRDWIAASVSTLGVILITTGREDAKDWLGPALVLAALVSFAAWVVMSKRLMRDYSSFCVTSWTILLGTLILVPIALFQGALPVFGTLHAATWLSLLYLGLLSTAVAFQLWNWGLREVSATTTGVIGNLEPLIGAALGVAFLGEPVGVTLCIGGALIVGAAFSVSV